MFCSWYLLFTCFLAVIGMGNDYVSEFNVHWNIWRLNSNILVHRQRLSCIASNKNMCFSCRQLLHSKTADLWNQRKLRLVSHGLLMRIFCMVYFHWTVEEFEEVWNPGNCEVWALETLRWIKEVSVSWFFMIFFWLQTVFWSFEGGYFFKMIFWGKHGLKCNYLGVTNWVIMNLYQV